jgi:chromosome segregation protein
MKIKRIEIFGFKSFHERTAIDLPEGICAIVGPNGCGKSNIMDALRWVMGEQSVRQLRGKSMDDVIFSGTNGRPPLNMAEVSLTLSNDNGSLPEQYRHYSELLITRRLYRSGERAYFLNKQPCRLKDITDIFLGSGMGAKSHAIIQQGNIGAITDAGPEERRGFIEEAAGISRYKARKLEALRKVETTRQNLLRLGDIIGEIARQMGGLKRQAKKAEFHQKVQGRLRRLDLTLGLAQHRALAGQIAATGLLLDQLRDSDAGHVSDLRRIDAEIEAIRLQRLQHEEQLGRQRSEKFELLRGADRLAGELRHLRAEVERLAAEGAQLEAMRRELTGKAERLQAELDGEAQRNVDLSGRLQAERRALAAAEEGLQGARGQIARLAREQEWRKGELMRLVAEEARCRNSVLSAANQRESLQRRMRRIDEEELLARRKVNALEQAETEARQVLESARLALAELDRQIAEHQAAARQASLALAQAVQRLQAIEAERSKTKSRAGALKKMADNLEWYKDGVRALLRGPRARHAGEGAPFLGLVADALEPEPGFAPAVECVLGESLQFILVERAEEGLEAIDFLQREGAGRCGFYTPAAFAAADGEPSPPSSPLLLSHVKVRDPFAPLIGRLLQGVLVAEDRQAALALQASHGAHCTVVTRDGGLLLQPGCCVGGSGDPQAGILAKKEELRQLEGALAALGDALLAAREAQHQAETALREREGALQRATTARHEALRAETEAEKGSYKLGEELRHARRHLEVVSLEQERLMGEASDADEEIARHNDQLQELSTAVADAQRQAAEAGGTMTAAQARLEACNREVTDRKVRLTAVEAGLESSSASLRRLNDFQRESRQRLQETEAAIGRTGTRLQEARLRIATHDQALAENDAAMRGLEAALTESEARFGAIEETLRRQDGQITAIRSRRESILQKIRSVETEQTQRQLSLEAIAARLVDRYHLPFAELAASLDGAVEEGPPRDTAQMEAELERCRRKIAKLGEVNLGAIREYELLRERHDFLAGQRDDLDKALDDLHKVIRRINRITQERFLETFAAVNAKLAEVFPRLFEGGSARLELSQPDNPLETGVEFLIHPPGKKLTQMSLLSGGEKALSAIAFIFAIFLIRPASFCLLDEIDAPLDEVNVFRFNHLLKMIGEHSQILMITHNKRSMEFADTLLGITMEHKGVSRLVTVNFDRTACDRAA